MREHVGDGDHAEKQRGVGAEALPQHGSPGSGRKPKTHNFPDVDLSSVDRLILRQHLKLEERYWWFVARRRILLGVLERNLDLKRGL
jgi:hypothetical protein